MESGIGTAQILAGALNVLCGARHAFHGLSHLEAALSHLKVHLLASLIQRQARHLGSRAGRTHPEFTFHPVPHGHVNHHAHVPYATDFLFESVEHVGVGERVAAHNAHVGQIGRQGQFLGLPAQFDGRLQEAQFGSCPGIFAPHCQILPRFALRASLWAERSIVHSPFSILHCRPLPLGVLLLVGQDEVLVERHSAQLAQEHARQAESVLHLRDLHLGFVYTHVDLQSVGSRGHALGNHLLNVVVELHHKVAETLGQALLLLQRNHEPIGFVDVVEHVLRLLLDARVGHVGADVGHAVGSAYGASHVEGLAHEHRAGPHRAGVGAEGINNALPRLVERRRGSRQHGCGVQAQRGEDGGQLWAKARRCEARHRVCAHITEGRLLVVAEQLHLATHVRIAA